MVVEVGDPAKAAAIQDSAEVTPQRVKARPAPVSKTKPSRRLQPGDLICGQCGEGNPPTRKFCSRCGEELATAEVVRARWWRRLLFWRRPRKAMAAGQRPGQPGARKSVRSRLLALYQRAWRIVGVVMLAASMIYIFAPPAREYVNKLMGSPVTAVKDRVTKLFNQKYVPVRPSQVVASAQVPEHDGGLAFDQFSNTYWSAAWNPETQPRVTVTFDRSTTISRIIVTAGASDDFIGNHRPMVIHLVYSNKQSDTIRPEDGAKPQTFELPNASDVTSIEIGVTDVYKSEKGQNVAIAEIELFAQE